MLVDAALRGFGPLRIVRLYAGQHLKSGRLVAILEDYAMPGFELLLSYPQRENLPFRTRAFVDFVVRTFERGLFE